MQEFETGAVRDTGGKGRMDLIPWSAILRVSRHMEDALTHYPERNWEKGLPMHSMIDSAFRHLAKYVDGMTDEDHLCAAATNLLMALWMEDNKPEMQDIPSRITNYTEKYEPKSKKCDYFSPSNSKCYKTEDREYCRCAGNLSDCEFTEK